jgi:hypothetical protein
MLFALLKGVGDTAQESKKFVDPAMKRAYDTGAGLGVMIWLMFWAAGSVVLGALAYFTRGKRELIEIETRSA